ncbi:MAG: quinone oxidoreductase [Chloroflexota bacterium]
MKAVQLDRHGPPDVLQLVDLDVPAPSGTQVLVRNHAIGVNYVDVQHRAGGTYNPLDLPLIPGIEAAGLVEAVGDEVTEFRIGDRIAYAGYMGGNYAEYTLVPQDRLFPVPATIDFDTAAATVLQGITAYVLTHEVYPVQQGDWMLVHAAAGGVGSLLVQIGHHLGATVVGTVSTAEKADFAAQLGADHIIRYTQADFAHVTNQLTADVGVHVVYDAVGATTFDGSLACLRKRGMLVIYGQSSDPVPPFDVNRLSGITPGSGRGSQSITWAAGSHYIEERADLLANASALFNLLSAGHITPHIADRLPLTDAAEAHRRLEARQVIGKLILVP